MPLISEKTWRLDAARVQSVTLPESPPATQVVLSFDVEEHFRIEAAAGLEIDPALKAHCSERLEPSTRWILDELDRFGAKATFFVVGEIARSHPRLIRAMANAGHEVASHSFDHRRVHHHTRESFRGDVRKSREILEDAMGRPVFGYRAPTFSVVKETAWALDILAEEGFTYDSSIYPIWHDRYGVPTAPRGPFRAKGRSEEILELPLATWRALRTNIPAGGGGYFRLLPLFFMERALLQARLNVVLSAAVLYFHPWEFDVDQARLPLSRLNSLRSYVGMERTRNRFETLLSKYGFTRAVEVANRLKLHWDSLPQFEVSKDALQ